MSEENGPIVDLFGDIWSPPAETRGRKRHVRDPQLAEKIAVLRATGETQEAIEQRVPLSVKTLRKYYSRELEGAPSLARSALVQVMWKQAMAGNVSAAKFIRDELANADEAAWLAKGRRRADAPRALEGEGAAAEPPANLGKRATANAEAIDAHEGTGWGGLVN